MTMTKTKSYSERMTHFYLRFYTGYLSNQLKISSLPFCSVINGGVNITRMIILNLYIYVVLGVSWSS